jgi:diguanylate cyclase (GGDEF)-like protein
VAEIEQELRGRAHTTAIAALEVVPFAMLIADGAAQVLAVNGRWMELSGLGRSNSLGPGWLSVLEPDTRSRLREEVLRVAREGVSATVDHQIGVPPHSRWVRWWISRHELEGTPLVAIGAADVDDDYARQANLYHLATHDSLTGLINRSHFIECTDQALRRGHRASRHVAVVYVDLDGFKRVNDRGGHSLGDRVLFAIASRLRHAVRSADLVARIGGDEFAVLCEGLSAAEQADVVARRIALALTESVELDGERWSVAASVGAAVDRGDPDNAEDLVDRADRAMYSVKLTRRGPQDDSDDLRPPPFTGAREDAPPPTGGLSAPPVGRRREGEDARAGTGAGMAFGGGDETGADTSRLGDRPGGGPTATPADEQEEARRALRDLAAAASAMAAEGGTADFSGALSTEATETTSPPAPVFAGAPSASPEAVSPRERLAADVINLRESIDSIRRMLDRLLAAESGIIDIRDPSGAHGRN